MSVRITPRWRATAAALALIGAGLIALSLGRFIQFNDTSGFGSDRWIMPWAWVALLLALPGLAVAVADTTARRVLGITSAILAALLIIGQIADPGFRFIWAHDEGELFEFEIFLGLAALFMLVPRWRSVDKPGEAGTTVRRPISVWARIAIYAATTVVVLFVAFDAGSAHYAATQCTDPFDDCDLAGLEGIVWAIIALIGLTLAAGASEIVLAVKRRSRPTT